MTIEDMKIMLERQIEADPTDFNVLEQYLRFLERIGYPYEKNNIVAFENKDWPSLVVSLREAKNDPHYYSRHEILGYLLDLEEISVLGVLLDVVINDSSEIIRNDTMWVLEEIMNNGIWGKKEDLAQLFAPIFIKSAREDPSPIVRLDAIKILLLTPYDQDVIEEVIVDRLINDESHDVRKEAAASLAKYPNALPHLIRSMDDRDGGVRINSIVAIGRIGDEIAIPILLEKLKARQWRGLRTFILRAIRQIARQSQLELERQHES